MNSVQTAFSLDPFQVVPLLSLLGGLGVNWLLGCVAAAVKGQFSFQQIGRILASQFASTEMRVIVGMLGTALFTALSTGLAVQALTGGNRALVQMILTITLNTLVAASGLYSVQLWHEDLIQLKAIFTGAPALPPKQVAGSGVQPGPVGTPQG